MSRLRYWMRRAARRIGWRGDALLTFALVDVFYGYTLWTASAELIGSNATYRWAAQFAPLPFWAGLWWLTAIVCTLAALRPHNHPRDDKIGFEAAIGIKVMWGLLCLGGTLFGHRFGAEVTVAAPTIWLGFARLVWRISVWTEPIYRGDDAS